nr:hypothetical protein Iba_scaffold21040CG0090 [Ipomoea batatas]
MDVSHVAALLTTFRQVEVANKETTTGDDLGEIGGRCVRAKEEEEETEKGEGTPTTSLAERSTTLRQGCPPRCPASDEHRRFVWPGEENNADAASNHLHDRAAPEGGATATAGVAAAVASSQRKVCHSLFAEGGKTTGKSVPPGCSATAVRKRGHRWTPPLAAVACFLRWTGEGTPSKIVSTAKAPPFCPVERNRHSELRCRRKVSARTSSAAHVTAGVERRRCCPSFIASPEFVRKERRGHRSA